MQIKTSRLIFPFDKAAVGIFPCLSIYSPVASACSGVRFFQNDSGSVWEGRTWVRCCLQAKFISMLRSGLRSSITGSTSIFEQMSKNKKEGGTAY